MKRKLFGSIFALCVCAVLTGSVSGFDGRDGVALSLNVPVEREYQSGERHFFSVAAGPNELIEIVCERRGVDVSLSAIAPDGAKISVSGAPSGFAGFDRLVFVAEKPGVYAVKIGSWRPGDFAGSYTVVLKNRRAATAADLERAAAARISGEARSILFGAENRLEKASAAIEKLERALALFEKTDDSEGRANTLFHLGLINGYELGEKAKAVDFYEKALEIWVKTGDEPARAVGLTYLADEIRDLDAPGKPRSYFTARAQNYFDEAVSLNRKSGNRPGEATALAYLCRLYNDTGNFQKGFETCREALRLEGGEDPLTSYRIYMNLASLYGNSGDAENSLKYNALALERLAAVGDFVSPFRRSFILGNIGGIYLNQRKFKEAEQNLREAFEISEKVRRKTHSAYLLVRLSLIYYETGRLPEALETAQKAVEYYRAFDPVKIQAALNALGKIQLALGQTPTARLLFAEAIDVNRANRDRYAEADSLYNLAKLENQAGNTEAARQNIALAINNSEIIRAQLLGKNQRASYLSILKKYYELEIELLVKMHEKTSDPRFLEQAWQTHEKVRARNLLESLIESGLNFSEFAPPGFFAAEQRLLEEIAAAEQRRSEASKSKNAARRLSAETDLNKKLAEYENLQETVRRQNPQFSAINQPRETAIADAQNLLDEKTALLEFALGERGSYVWVIRRNSFRLVKLPAKNALERAAREFYVALTDRTAKTDAAIVEKSKSLSRLVLSPLSADLQDAEKIVVIADGALQLIPFSALSAAESVYEPLASTAEIINAPSFASLAFLREQKATRRKPDNRLLAVFADPIFQNDDERFALYKQPKPEAKKIPETLARALRDFGLERLARLPFSGIEAREIGKFAPEKTVLALGADASRQAFLRGDFSSYRILHFATHGFLNQQNPELSGLVLSLYDREGNAQNGFLRVIDLYSLRVNSDLVVLSACQTALGKEMDGEGIVGLTRGFMYAGAAGVVSSLWKVEDAATAELMKRFYRSMLKDDQTPAAALRTAQNELRRIPRFRNPRHWSGFTLNGGLN